MRLICFPLLLLYFFVAITHAQSAPSVPLIHEIRFENIGTGQLDESFIRAHMRITEGQPFDRIALGSDVRALLDSGRFTDVIADLEPKDDGVSIILSISKRYRLERSVAVTGAEHFRMATIRDSLGLMPGDLVDDFVMAGRIQKLQQKYHKALFPDVSFQWRISETDRRNGLAVVSLEIDEGSRARLRKILFPGNESLSNRDLRRLTRRPAIWNPLRLFRRIKYDESYLSEVRAGLLQFYVDEGYLDAEIGLPDVNPARRKGRFDVYFPVNQGPLYRIGTVTITGTEIFPLEDLNAAVSLQSGDVAGMRAISQARQLLRDYYGSRGYLDTRVAMSLEQDPLKPVVDVTFDVTEGMLTYIRNIRIRNNIRTRDKVIRRELLVYPGDIYDEVRVRTSERRIRNLGFFSDVRSFPERTEDEQWRDLVLSVEEQRTGQFMMGAGFSSIDKLMGFLELSLGNFDLTGWPYLQGGGQKLKLRASVGSRRRDYELSFVEPWFLDRQLALGVDLYRNEIDYSDYDVKRVGAALSVSRPLPGPNRVRLRYRIESARIRDIADTNRYVYVESPEDEYFFTRERDTVSSALELSVSHDSRNHAFIPSRGTRAGISAELTGGPLGADVDIYRLSARAIRYFPLWRGHVFSIRGRYEVVDSYGDSADVPISDRLFAGGGRTLRGFKYRDIGPKVVRHRGGSGMDPFEPGAPVLFRPVGGQSLAVANIEYTIPVVNGIRFAGFYDIGNVWRDPYELHLDDLAESAGLGLRFDLPGFPIRIDRAWIIESPDPYARPDRWVFWIGYDF